MHTNTHFSALARIRDAEIKKEKLVKNDLSKINKQYTFARRRAEPD